MHSLETVAHRDLLSVQDALRDQLRIAASLEACAQHGVEALCHAFSGSLQAQMTETTPILTLLGTCGKGPGWSIPMVARMLQKMGVELGLKAEHERPFVQKALGSGWSGSSMSKTSVALVMNRGDG